MYFPDCFTLQIVRSTTKVPDEELQHFINYITFLTVSYDIEQDWF